MLNSEETKPVALAIMVGRGQTQLYLASFGETFKARALNFHDL